MTFKRRLDFTRHIPIDADDAHGVTAFVAIHARVQLNVLQRAIGSYAQNRISDVFGQKAIVRFTFADVPLGCFWSRYIRLGGQTDDLPSCTAWFERLSARPAARVLQIPLS